MALTGCGDSASPTPPPTSAAPPPESPVEQLHARVAAAQDLRYSASYALSVAGAPQRTVTVTLAKDGSWRVDVPGGAHGGTRDVAIVSTVDGVFQCALSPATGCVKVAAAGKGVPAEYDPRVHHPFTDWLDVLGDPSAALSVVRDTSLSVSRGECFSVESNAAALAPPVEPGIYCFDTAGVLTGARFGGRTLLLAGDHQPPPKTVQLPAPITPGPALSTKAPLPSPTPSPTPRSSPS